MGFTYPNDPRSTPAAAPLDFASDPAQLYCMKAATLAATFDGQHIRLQGDYPLPRNARLLVTVLPEGFDDDNAFLDSWRKLSAQSLSRAYSQDEPDYTLSMVREPNPDYQGR